MEIDGLQHSYLIQLEMANRARHNSAAEKGTKRDSVLGKGRKKWDNDEPCVTGTQDDAHKDTERPTVSDANVSPTVLRRVLSLGESVRRSSIVPDS